jgi:ubiquinone/menaquinone biosynthesis C-methylase UbiE
MSHDKIASTFDQWAESGRGDRMEEGHGDVVAQVVEQLDIRPGFQILDLGCGTGWATRILAQTHAGVQAIGVDASRAMVARAEELHSYTIRARYEVGHFEALEFPDGKFDLVFSMEALYYAPDLEKALSEIHRVLKPGGEASIVMDLWTGRPATEGWGPAVGLLMRSHTPEEWKQLLEAAGFGDVSCTQVVDRRPVDEAAFEPSEYYPDLATYRAYREAGALWLRGRKS